MVTLKDVEMGVCTYIDTELMSKMDGIAKWMAGAGMTMIPKVIENKYHDLKGMLMDMGIATEDDRVDIDKLQDMLVNVATKYGKVTQSFAGVKVSMDEDDIRKVCMHIRTV